MTAGTRSTREQCMTALFTLLTTGALSTTWATTGRRLKLWTDAAQPALFLCDRTENYNPQPRGVPSRLLIECAAIIYVNTGDPNTPLGPVLNAILQNIDVALAPDNLAANVLTLGGLVSHCWIEGSVFKDPGDLDGQAMAVLPIRMLLP